MDIAKILSHIDHTNLNTKASWEDIKTLCDEGIKHSTASVCIPPCFVKQAKKYINDSIKLCTVIGFPNGYATTATKVYETKDAVACGADEIDMVINLCDVANGDYANIAEEITLIKRACEDKILKVIIEACLLTESQKIELCKIITNAKADYIKTSTGFSFGGATQEDIVLFSNHIGSNVKIKAAGGIKTLMDAEAFILLGASRIGASSIIKDLNNIIADNELY